MPLDPTYDEESFVPHPHPAEHSGARWMVAITLCLVMLGLACTL